MTKGNNPNFDGSLFDELGAQLDPESVVRDAITDALADIRQEVRTQDVHEDTLLSALSSLGASALGRKLFSDELSEPIEVRAARALATADEI